MQGFFFISTGTINKCKQLVVVKLFVTLEQQLTWMFLDFVPLLQTKMFFFENIERQNRFETCGGFYPLLFIPYYVFIMQS